jgi:rhamnosyltransferase
MTAMAEQPTSSNTCAIVISFNPLPVNIDGWASVSAIFTNLLIVDNGSNEATLVGVRESCTRNRAEKIENAHNLGLASAFNMGAAFARQRGYEWLLLLDQDTVLAPNALTIVQEAWNELDEPESVGILAMSFEETLTGYSTNGVASSERASEVATVHSSGSLVPITKFNEIGPFLEPLFIDCVDHEYCLRARSRGFRVMQVTRVCGKHTFGSPTRVRLLGRELTVFHLSSFRIYYSIRNVVFVASRYLRRDRKAVAALLASYLKMVCKEVTFAEHRWTTTKSVVAGARDGVRISVCSTPPLGWSVSKRS